MASNSMNQKNLYRIENSPKQLEQIKAYLLRLYSEASHTRWITPEVLFHFDSLLVTERQFAHVKMWVKKVLKLDVKFTLLDNKPKQ